MANDATINLTSTLLPLAIQQVVTGTTTITPADANDKWFYNSTLLGNSSRDMIEGVYIANLQAHGTVPTTIHADDKCRFIWIYNTGTTDGSTSTTNSVYIVTDGGTAANGTDDAIEVPAGYTWFGQLPNTTVGNVHSCIGQANAAGTASGTVQCLIAGILDDVA